MPLEIGIWRIDTETKTLDMTGLDVEDRLEQILDDNITVLNPNWMIVGRQVRTAYGKVIDLLCMDRDGNLAAVELKRDMTERHTVAQALDYGSWVRQLKDDDLVRIFDGYRKTYHREKQTVSINEAFCKNFNLKQMPDELNESHELVIVGSSFDPATERIVQYLSDEYGVRI
jgi:Endonuclease NucS C-terminal domain